MSTDKGVCRMSIVPLRSFPADTREMTSQLLFGEHYEVLEESDNQAWLKIKNYHDGYEGWIDKKQHYPISEAYFNQINQSNYKVCLEISSSILFRKSTIQIVLGSILPISGNEMFKMEEQLAFNGEAKSLGQRRDFEFLKLVALRYLNAPYLWGGRSPFGIDCSGFVQQVFRINGYFLPRDSAVQADIGDTITKFEDKKPGDLAFFEDDNKKISHVGIILDDSKIIHCSGKVRIDAFVEQGIEHDKTKKVTHKLRKIKRILKES